MWTVTVFEKDTFRIFQYENKHDATKAMKAFQKNAFLTFTNPF